MVKPLFAQILLILSVLQKHSILHRDIKLDNLLMQGKQVKVCDFGVSKVVVRGQRITDQCGTPAYLSPEVLRGTYEGFASDIWSMGVMLYLMLVGKVPFKGSSMNELNQSIQGGHLNFMEMKQAGLTTECMGTARELLIPPLLIFVELIRKMLTTNPKARITLDEIYEHSWLKSETQLSRALAKVHEACSKKPINFDPKLVNQVRTSTSTSPPR